MRLAILCGALFIAESITRASGMSVLNEPANLRLITLLGFLFALMDFAEFIKLIYNRK